MQYAEPSTIGIMESCELQTHIATHSHISKTAILAHHLFHKMRYCDSHTGFVTYWLVVHPGTSKSTEHLQRTCHLATNCMCGTSALRAWRYSLTSGYHSSGLAFGSLSEVVSGSANTQEPCKSDNMRQSCDPTA